MRPPSISETAIRAVIRDLSFAGSRVTGVAVRRELALRHGLRGGVARVYRVLEAMRREAGAGASAPVRPTSVPADSPLDALARAERAEARERLHQERWARETDALRRRLAGLEPAVRELALANQRVADLTRALASAQARISRLEAQLSDLPR
jgi:hypothetical protein